MHVKYLTSFFKLSSEFFGAQGKSLTLCDLFLFYTFTKDYVLFLIVCVCAHEYRFLQTGPLELELQAISNHLIWVLWRAAAHEAISLAHDLSLECFVWQSSLPLWRWAACTTSRHPALTSNCELLWMCPISSAGTSLFEWRDHRMIGLFWLHLRMRTPWANVDA